MFADLALMLVSPWLKLLDPQLFVIGPTRNLYIWAMIILGAICFYFLTKPVNRDETRTSELKAVFLAGIFIVATGMISTYAIGYIVHLKIAPWNSRFSIAALLGLSMLSAAIIELVITSKQIRHVFLAVLVGLLIGWHNQNTLNFKLAWEKQTRLYQQLMWRAPSIEPNTAIIASEEILGYMGDYPTSFAINTVYESKPVDPIPYWFFALSENFHASAAEATGTGELTAQRTMATFRGNKQDIIFITYQPENKECLWVLRPEDADYKYLPGEIKAAALFSNYQNIQPDEIEHPLYDTIVNENKMTWCYFYQKADLARQMGDWEKVNALWQEAQSYGFQPDNGFEYVVFIEAAAHGGDWEQALFLTNRARKTVQGMYMILCPTWQRLAEVTPASDQKDAHVAKAYDVLQCSP